MKIYVVRAFDTTQVPAVYSYAYYHKLNDADTAAHTHVDNYKSLIDGTGETGEAPALEALNDNQRSVQVWECEWPHKMLPIELVVSLLNGGDHSVELETFVEVMKIKKIVTKAIYWF